MNTPQSSTNAQLQAAFHFTGDDLEANQRGILSDRQQHMLTWRLRSNMALGGAFAAIMFVLGVVALVTLQILVTGLLWALAGTVAYLLRRQYHTTHSTFALGAVEHVRGEARITRRTQSTGERHTLSSVCSLSVGWMRFDLTEKQCRALSEGGDYTVYFLTGLGVVLSVERHDVFLPFF